MNCGIYKLINTINNKIYIGSSKNLKNRKYIHFYNLRKNKHFNIHLQRAFNKCENCIEFKIIEYCTEENRLKREQYFINKLNPNYNIILDVEKNYYTINRYNNFKRTYKNTFNNSLKNCIWFHPRLAPNKTELLTALELKEKYNINRRVSYLKYLSENNIIESCDGWSCVGYYDEKNTFVKINHKENKNNGFFEFEDNFGNLHILTCAELSKIIYGKQGGGHITELIRGLRSHCKGWKCLSKFTKSGEKLKLN